jgi:hypothetical protein
VRVVTNEDLGETGAADTTKGAKGAATKGATTKGAATKGAATKGATNTTNAKRETVEMPVLWFDIYQYTTSRLLRGKKSALGRKTLRTFCFFLQTKTFLMFFNRYFYRVN